MVSLARFMRDTGNADIFAALGEVAVIDGVAHPGVFNRRYAEVSLPDGAIVGLDISFACSLTHKVLELREGDAILIRLADDEAGEYYRFRRRVPDKGDETKHVLLELST